MMLQNEGRAFVVHFLLKCEYESAASSIIDDSDSAHAISREE